MAESSAASSSGLLEDRQQQGAARWDVESQSGGHVAWTSRLAYAATWFCIHPPILLLGVAALCLFLFAPPASDVRRPAQQHDICHKEGSNTSDTICIYTHIADVLTKDGYSYDAYQDAIDSIYAPPAFLTDTVESAEPVARSIIAGTPGMEAFNDSLPVAVKYGKLVNRFAFMQDALLQGDMASTMAMQAQLLAETVLLDRLQGKPNQKVLFAGCGLGDWAATTSLALGAGSQVWCFNYGAGVTNRSRQIMSMPQKQLFDLAALQNSDGLMQRANGIQGLGGGPNSERSLGWLCTEPMQQECQLTYGIRPLREVPQGRLTYELEGFGNSIGNNFNAVAYGNALRPDELGHVRAALATDGFALVPVCLYGPTKNTEEGSAPYYCAGAWWLLSKQASISAKDAPGPSDRKLWPFMMIMRPLGSPNKGVVSKRQGKLWL
eukprot:TRINITY_DN9567_c0_g1_i1.p1 TRINITY_DN9567_c0_g1~~TRINITY_DN9567_c0_g1_i1.p1  ORF type:complete len:436 (+),score=88.11 TRINITY_DN9567_c0_g1_i1:212-1519(+)